ncbi:FAD-dependent oxidoreductase [Bacillus kwashiorkori]|uniref:FAD-dependent oxidoreductase n=1 Tax=Bacillus kwashiorkori TaxID=1522318 RepID=UPI00078361BD|nr:FAD-dependent oxidoreductase [Bacillus kwashiorkori]
MAQKESLVYEPEQLEAYDFRRAMEEASRCLLCEDAPCSQGCPAGTDPGSFIRSIRFKNVTGAAETIRENNILGASCALICPQERLCQAACSRCGIDKPIEIGKLQQYAMEHERLTNKTFLTKGDTFTDKRVACIGAGPASLACAAELAKAGVEVTIYDEHSEAGGMLRYLIPPYRLPDQVVNQDIAQLEKLGVKFELNHKVSKEELAKLRTEYDTVFVGAGMWGAKTLPIPGADLEGVVTAIDFLSEARTNRGEVKELGNVVIIGGGDVAMDCAATSKLLGATHIYDVFVETLEAAPAVQQEKEFVFQLGVPMISEFKPVEFNGNGKVQRVKFEHMTNGSTMEIAADTVILAVGQKLREDASTFKEEEGLYIGGDLLNGGDTVVRAVNEGKEAAAKIMESFRG